MNIDYNNLPKAIEDLGLKLDELREILNQKVSKSDEIPKYLSLEKALEFLNSQGYPFKKSSIYKMTSAGGIPHRKMNNKLIFLPEELQQWCDNKIVGKEIDTSSTLEIIKNAQKKNRNLN